MKDLPFSRRELVHAFGRLTVRAPTPCGASTELPQVRKQEIEDGTVTLSEILIGAIELQPRLPIAARTEPQAHHVLDANRAGDLLVQLEPVELAPGEEIRILASAFGGCHRILVPVANACGMHVRSHRSARLTAPDDRALRIPLELLVVGDHVAWQEPPQRLEHRLGKGTGPVDVARLA